MIKHPTDNELQQPCPCGSGKRLEDCCLEKVMTLLAKMNQNRDPTVPFDYQYAKRGFEHWKELIDLDPQTASEVQHLGETIENPIDSFFRFWKGQLIMLVRWLRKE